MKDVLIKKVVRKIYQFDLANCMLTSGDEMVVTAYGNEFTNTFKKRDLDNGVIVTPSNYSQGLVYKSTNGGEFYNPVSWAPDLVQFSYNFFGLKKGAFYKVSVIGRNVSVFNRITDITDDRSLEVTDDQQDLIIMEDLTDYLENKTFSGIFRASSNEANLHFRIGKIYINNIILEEVELADEENENIDGEANVILESGKSDIAAYCVFSFAPTVDPAKFSGKFLELNRITGKGVNLYYNKIDKRFTIERDNIEDTIGEAFTLVHYTLDINTNKIVNKGIFDRYNITKVSPDVSPNTLKPGYIEFEFVKDGRAIELLKNNLDRIAIIVHRYY